jgi:hypothetical protein
MGEGEGGLSMGEGGGGIEHGGRGGGIEHGGRGSLYLHYLGGGAGSRSRVSWPSWSQKGRPGTYVGMYVLLHQ